MQNDDVFFDATMKGHRYRFVRCLWGLIAKRMFLVESTTSEGDALLACTVHNPNDIPVETLRKDLGYQGVGLLELVDILRPDPPSTREDSKHQYLMQQWVMLERLPRGASWLPDLTHAALGAARATRLARSVGEILLRNADVDATAILIRPELIWASLDGDQPLATALTTRHATFVRHKHRHSAGQHFTRSYAPFDPPDAGVTSASLSFPLALMLQEWATRKWPFANNWYGNPGPDIGDRAHPVLELPLPLQRVLHRALTEDVAKRIPLPEFLDELRALTPEQLGA
jgi:hypothetical protein